MNKSQFTSSDEGKNQTTREIRRIIFVGATKNFFKVGYYTIHYLAKNYPQIKLRLAVPNIEDAVSEIIKTHFNLNAAPNCKGADVELVRWDPERPDETLPAVFQDCDASLLVAPINNRIEVSKRYVQMCIECNLAFLINIGVQFQAEETLTIEVENQVHNQSVQIAKDAREVENMLEKSGIRFCNLNLPMFLENLLYQVDDIREINIFQINY